MLPRLPKLITYTTLLLLGGVFLGPLVTYATLTLDSTSITTDDTLKLKGGNVGVGNITPTSNLHVSGTLTVTATSTLSGAATVSGALTLSNPSTNSLIYTNSTGVVTALASSTAGKILTASGTAPYFSWETTGSLANLTLTGPSTNSPIYLNSAGLITALASSTAGKVLMATGTAPYFSWETSSGGITSLGGLTGATQTFATSSDTNIELKIGSSGTTHTFTSLWAGVLPISRGGTNTSTALTAGSVLFSDGTAITQNNSGLFWDNTNTRLGIGAISPSSTLHVTGNIRVTGPTTNSPLYTDSNGQLTGLASSTAGKVLTATSTAPYFAWESSGRVLTYNEVTTNVAVNVTTEATATTIVTADAYTFDGTTPVLITAWFPYFADSSDRLFTLVLYDGSSSIGLLGIVDLTGSVTARYAGVTVMRRLTPSAASHTYSIRGYVNAAGIDIPVGTGGSGNQVPGFIRIAKDN